MIEDKRLKNGLDLLLHCYLTIECMESYKLRGMSAKYGNLFKNELEKSVMKAIDEEFKDNEEFILNAQRMKKRMVKQIAFSNEVDQILLSDFVDKFFNNIELVRKKGLLFFDKLV